LGLLEHFLTAIGLVLVIEGALYALFPAGMQRIMAQALALPQNILRLGGIAFALIGFWVVYYART
tara:strand:+ start:788 stop:982 length:195 start_codon:yes stop_codon:yes gene_type:complete